jgi:hypothetical protein
LKTCDWENLTKTLEAIDLDGNGEIERSEMFNFVVKVYTSGLLTAKGDLKKQATQDLIESKYHLSLPVQAKRSLCLKRKYQLRKKSAATILQTP